MSENNHTDGLFTIELTGRIDSGNAAEVETDILSRLNGQNVKAIVLDASALDYISSAGLRVILRLKKTWKDLTIENVNPDIYETLEMTGFTEMMTVKKAYRVVSVEGCEVIGEGFNGKVYRIDKDNVVKTYKNADALAEIQHEREVARLALILGVPTAISYDVVRVGDSYGSVFELLNAKSFSKLLAKEPDRYEFCVREYVQMLRKIHSITVPQGKLPSVKEKVLKQVTRTAEQLPKELGEKLVSLVRAVPESDHMIHGDYHTKNIVLCGDEVLLIDMDTLSVGHPIFELFRMYNAFVGYSEYDPEIVLNFQGYPAETARRFWHDSLSAYLGTTDEARIKDVEDKVRCVSYGNLIDWITRHPTGDEAKDEATRALWKSELVELLGRLDSLEFDLPGEEASDPDRLELDALSENLDRVLDFVNERLEGADCPPKTQMQINIAIEEIFVNIAHYAYAPGTGRMSLTVKLSGDPLEATFIFVDRGKPYDPLKKEDPDITLSAEERQIGGLGIFMTKKIMDRMDYAYRDGQNILTLVKKL